MDQRHPRELPAWHGRSRRSHQDHQLRCLRQPGRRLGGLAHISELADHKVENPQDVVKSGESVEVKILRVDTDERKIGLSLKRAQWGDNDTTAYDGSGPVGGGGGQRIRRIRPSLQGRYGRPRSHGFRQDRTLSLQAQILFFNMVNFQRPPLSEGAFLCLKCWTSQHRQTKAAKVNKPIRLRWGVAAVNRYNKFMFMAGSFGGCTC